VPDETHLDPAWLEGAEVVGVSSGASAPEVLVDRLLEKLASFGYADVETKVVTTEDVTFSLPPWLRDQAEVGRDEVAEAVKEGEAARL
jgi:4-hydroxy-3-methylbut-2-enyl diphosphate reductase